MSRFAPTAAARPLRPPPPPPPPSLKLTVIINLHVREMTRIVSLYLFLPLTHSWHLSHAQILLRSPLFKTEQIICAPRLSLWPLQAYLVFITIVTVGLTSPKILGEGLCVE